MKFEILQENLSQALVQAMRFVSSKAQLPILGNILLEAKAGILKLNATDLENGISISMGAKIEEDGELTVPAKIFTEYVLSLPAGKVEIIEEKGGLEIVCGKAQAKMAISPADEFPKIGESEELKRLISLDILILKEIAEKVAFCASSDLVSKPAMTGVYFDNKEGVLKIVATDGFRLSLFEQKGEGEDFALNLPVKPIEEVAKAAGSESKKIEVFANEEKNTIVFKTDGVEIFTRTIEGKYPPYEKIVPQGATTRFIADCEVFLKVLKQAGVFAQDASNIVKFQIKDNSLTLFSQTANLGENKTEIDVEKTGEDLEISFNCRFVIDIISRFKAKKIVFESNGSGKPGVFKDEDEKNFLHLVMPVKSS